MEIARIVALQTLVMFLYMLIGYVLFKTGKLTVNGSKDIATLLVWLIIPVVMINSFCVECTPERTRQLLYCFLLGFLAEGIGILIGRLLFRRSPIDHFAAAFSNVGFMGIPLVQAALGQEAVFFLIGILAMLNILQWVYGVRVLTNGKVGTGVKGIILNPLVLSAIIGLILYFTGLGPKLPGIVRTTITGICALNTPLPMLVLGCYLAQADLKKLLTTPRLYVLSAVRLLLVPAVTLLVFWPLPIPVPIKLTVFIAASTPVGANVAVYSQIHGLDYPYACQTVVLSTLLSIITMPLVLMAASFVF